VTSSWVNACLLPTSSKHPCCQYNGECYTVTVSPKSAGRADLSCMTCTLVGSFFGPWHRRYHHHRHHHHHHRHQGQQPTKTRNANSNESFSGNKPFLFFFLKSLARSLVCLAAIPLFFHCRIRFVQNFLFVQQRQVRPTFSGNKLFFECLEHAVLGLPQTTLNGSVRFVQNDFVVVITPSRMRLFRMPQTFLFFFESSVCRVLLSP